MQWGDVFRRLRVHGYGTCSGWSSYTSGTTVATFQTRYSPPPSALRTGEGPPSLPGRRRRKMPPSCPLGCMGPVAGHRIPIGVHQCVPLGPCARTRLTLNWRTMSIPLWMSFSQILRQRRRPRRKRSLPPLLQGTPNHSRKPKPPRSAVCRRGGTMMLTDPVPSLSMLPSMGQRWRPSSTTRNCGLDCT